MPEAQAPQQRVERLHERAVRAPVDGQRAPHPGRLGGFEVGVHVGAAEGVDGLFGVGDQDERRLLTGKGQAQDGPLVGIGVLELIDEHDPEAPAQLRRGGGAAIGLQGLLEADDQVVEGHHPQPTLALLELIPGSLGQPAAHRAQADVLGQDGTLG